MTIEIKRNFIQIVTSDLGKGYNQFSQHLSRYYSRPLGAKESILALDSYSLLCAKEQLIFINRETLPFRIGKNGTSQNIWRTCDGSMPRYFEAIAKHFHTLRLKAPKEQFTGHQKAFFHKATAYDRNRAADISCWSKRSAKELKEFVLQDSTSGKTNASKFNFWGNFNYIKMKQTIENRFNRGELSKMQYDYALTTLRDLNDKYHHNIQNNFDDMFGKNNLRLMTKNGGRDMSNAKGLAPASVGSGRYKADKFLIDNDEDVAGNINQLDCIKWLSEKDKQQIAILKGTYLIHKETVLAWGGYEDSTMKESLIAKLLDYRDSEIFNISKTFSGTTKSLKVSKYAGLQLQQPVDTAMLKFREQMAIAHTSGLTAKSRIEKHIKSVGVV